MRLPSTLRSLRLVRLRLRLLQLGIHRQNPLFTHRDNLLHVLDLRILRLRDGLDLLLGLRPQLALIVELRLRLGVQLLQPCDFCLQLGVAGLELQLCDLQLGLVGLELQPCELGLQLVRLGLGLGLGLGLRLR